MESQVLFSHRVLISAGILSLVIGLIFVQSCKDFGSTGPTGEALSFGIDGKVALRLVVDGEYLYACAGPWGLWRSGLRDDSWNYLGLADSQQLGRSYSGVLDVAPRGNDLLVAYFGASLHRDPDSTYAVWRSTNGGSQWFRSDSGIPQSRIDPEEFDVLNCIRRSPHDPMIVMGVAGAARFVSTNGGDSWLIYGRRGTAIVNDGMAWSPWKRGEAWIFGTTGTEEAYQYKVVDIGATRVVSVNFCALGFCGVGGVYDMAFDWDSADTIFACTSVGVFVTGDDGASWHRGPDVFPLNRAWIILEHPVQKKIYLLATSARVYLSTDGLLSFTKIADYGTDPVYSMALHPGTNMLFVATNLDVHRIALPIH